MREVCSSRVALAAGSPCGSAAGWRFADKENVAGNSIQDRGSDMHREEGDDSPSCTASRMQNRSIMDDRMIRDRPGLNAYRTLLDAHKMGRVPL